MRVSVIVPLYNRAAHIERALTSIAEQTHCDLEILVVDDGSTDGGGEKAARFPDSRCRYFRQANAGPGAARNRGLAEARSELVAFLDADDEWDRDFLAQGLSLLRQAGSDVAAAATGHVLEPGSRSTRPMWYSRGLREGIQRLRPDSDPMFVTHLSAYLTPCTTLARAEILRRWGGFYAASRCLYGEDTHLWLQVLLNHSVAISFEPLVRIHTDASRLSRNLAGPRPVEPFLSNPAPLERACPPALRNLLRDVLAIFAARTACMLAYWGLWHPARQLLRTFCPWSKWRLPYFAMAQVAATPIGAEVGRAARLLRRGGSR